MPEREDRIRGIAAGFSRHHKWRFAHIPDLEDARVVGDLWQALTWECIHARPPWKAVTSTDGEVTLYRLLPGGLTSHLFGDPCYGVNVALALLEVWP